MDEKEFKDLSLFQNQKINRLLGNKIFDNENILISTIIFCDQFLHLEKTIFSIQKQSFKNHEIILVYDNGTRENFKQIKSLVNRFSNIKLLKNEYCQGIICSLYTGLSYTSGVYTLILQPGMTLYSKNTFDIFKEKLLNRRYDIVEFQSLINNDDKIQPNSLSLYVCKHNINKDLNVNKIKINNDYIGIDEDKEILFNKFIATDKLKTVVTDIYEFSKMQNTSIYNYYDDMILFALNRNYKRPKFIKTFGTIQYINKIRRLRMSQIMNNERQKTEDSIYYINYLFENTKNNINDKIY